MAREPTTWIKLDRNITRWRWYWDSTTFRVWVHLLLTAEIKDRQIGNRVLKRGSILTNYGILADELNLTYDQVRRSVENLKDTKEITILRHGKFVEISIVRYKDYQGENPIKTQSKPNQNPIDHYKNIKNNKNTLSLTLSHKPYHIPTLDEVREYERESGLGKDPDMFYKHYQAEGWKANGKKVYSWKRLYDNWQMPEIKTVQNRPKRFTDSDGVTYEWVNGNYERVRK